MIQRGFLIKFKNRNKKDFAIPLNSMSDIAFLLLIFIMVIALINFRREIKIEYAVAEGILNTQAERNLEIWIDVFGNVYIDGEISNYREIENAIIDFYVAQGDTMIHIIADSRTPYEKVNAVLEILQVLQYRTVSFVVRDG